MLAFWSLMIFFVSFSGCFWSNFCEGYYNAKDHPDVKNKRRSEEEILSEFLDTFEQHHAYYVPLSITHY